MRVLILGAGGMLGHKIYMRLKDKMDTWAMARGEFARYAKWGVFDQKRFMAGVKADDEKTLLAALDVNKPKFIINCIGVTTRKIGPDDEAQVIRINSVLPHVLNAWGRRNGARVIHFSTDCVFSGKTGPYTEADIPDAEDLYGRSKLLGELYSAPGITLRSSIIGHEISHRTELVEWLISQRGGRIKGFSEVIYSGVTTNYMAYLVDNIIQANVELSGLYQFGSEPISKYELLSKLNSALNLGIAIDKDASKKSDKSLAGNRLYETLKNTEKPSWDRMIAELAAEHTFYQRWAA